MEQVGLFETEERTQVITKMKRKVSYPTLTLERVSDLRESGASGTLEIKHDGQSAWADITSDSSMMIRADGKQFPQYFVDFFFGKITEKFREQLGSIYFTGEIVWFDIFSHEKLNAVVSNSKTQKSFNSYEGFKEELKNYAPVFYVWNVRDVSQADIALALNEKREIKNYKLSDLNGSLDLTNVFMTYKVENVFIDNALEMTEKFIAEGFEGTIFKLDGHMDIPGETTTAFKIKQRAGCDLRIVAVIYGSGKATGVISKLILRSEDGILRTGATLSGPTHKRRITEKEHKFLMGKIVTAYSSGLNPPVENKRRTLRHAVVNLGDLRLDKDTADSFDRIVEIIAGPLVLSKTKS